jgi:peptide/nickel transport system substrate-binding protein
VTRPRIVGALLVGLAVLLAGCGAPAPEDSTQRLTAAIPGDPVSLDWGLNTDALTIDIAQNIFEPLFAADRSWQPRPMLADGYTLTDANSVYTIPLRHDVTFHNGQPMTAADVVASLDRWFAISGQAQLIKSALRGVSALDPYTVRVAFDRPVRSFIPDLASLVQPCIVLPASIARAAGKKPLTDAEIIGTGPYQLDRFVHGQYVDLRRFPGYHSRTEDWGGLNGRKVARIPQLRFRVVTDSTVRLNGLSTGQWQYAQSLDNDSYDLITGNTELTALPERSSLIEFLLINSGAGPFRSLAARQGLNLLLDKRGLAEATLGPAKLWEPQTGQFAFPDDTAMYSTAGMDTYRAHDPVRAKQLLNSAGIGENTPIRILTTHTYPNYYQMAVVVQSELRSVGISAQLQVYDFPTMISKLSSDPGSWDLSMTSFAGEIMAPTQVLFLTPKWPGGYRSAAMDAAIARYEASADDTAAKAAVDEIQSVVWREVPDIGIGKQVKLDAVTRQVKDYQNFVGQGFWNAYLAPAQAED